MSTNANDMAFPVNYVQLGMTKREYFAALAMQGILSNRNIDGSCAYANSYCNYAVQFADALIAELAKGQS